MTDRQRDARGKTICLPTLKGGDIIVVPLFGAAFAAPNKGTRVFFALDLYQQC